jgi:hypothetical protein
MHTTLFLGGGRRGAGNFVTPNIPVRGSGLDGLKMPEVLREVLKCFYIFDSYKK